MKSENNFMKILVFGKYSNNIIELCFVFKVTHEKLEYNQLFWNGVGEEGLMRYHKIN